MQTESIADVELFLATASWSVEQDGICVEGRSPSGELRTVITRAGLASLVGRDRCELSASKAWEIFDHYAGDIIPLVQREYALRPSAFISIDYSEVERPG